MRAILVVSIVLAACSSSPADPDAAPRDRSPESSLPDRSADLRLDQRADTVPCKLLKPYSTKNATCNQCAEASCCVEINACLAEVECDESYVNCTLACALGPAPDAGMDSCLALCAKDFPEGKARYDVAIGCADSKCTACR